MALSVGQRVTVVDGRTGVVVRVNGNGTYAVTVDDDPVRESTRGHAAVRGEAAPAPEYPADRLPETMLAPRP